MYSVTRKPGLVVKMDFEMFETEDACGGRGADEPPLSVIGVVVAEALAYRGVSTKCRPPPLYPLHIVSDSFPAFLRIDSSFLQT